MSATTNRRQIIDRLQREIERIERKPVCRTRFVKEGLGFPAGALSELLGGPASGKTGLALSSMAHATRQGLVAFVDGRHELYPPAAQALGVDLARLLIVRPHPPSRQALWAAELLLASGAFAMVAVDVSLEDERPERAETMLRRLQRAAAKGGSAAVWLGTLHRTYRVPAAVRIDLEGEKCGAGHAA